jgi:hypothetical protein
MTVAQLIDDAKVYSEEVIGATKELARSKPWQGTIEQRQEKLLAYHQKLCAAYDVEVQLAFANISDAPMGGGTFDRETRTLTLLARISIVSYMHFFTRARGAGEREAFKWSINLFKRHFPKSFERAEKVGPFLLTRGSSIRLQAAQEADETRDEDGEL